MFALGLILILLAALAIVAAVFGSSETAVFLGQDLTALAIFLIGLVSGLFVLWGFAFARHGVRRSMQQRRETRQLQELSAKLDQVELDQRTKLDDDQG